MSMLQAIVLALLQGLTELFPISSLGHAVVVPALLHWHIDNRTLTFLPFLVVLHAATALALLAYFWRDWLTLGLAAIGGGRPETRVQNRRLLGLLIVATLPAVVLGFLFEHAVRDLFAAPAIAALFLVVNGVMLLIGDRLGRRERERGLAQIGWRDALIVGFWQCLAFIPGLSRSGATMVGGLLQGLHADDAARLSFLMATPVIAGAAVLETPKLIKAAHAGLVHGGPVVAAGVIAAIAAYASVAFLMRYFGRHDTRSLRPFAIYCWVAGALSLALLLLA
mgnify:CR=1 FL=1